MSGIELDRLIRSCLKPFHTVLYDAGFSSNPLADHLHLTKFNIHEDSKREMKTSLSVGLQCIKRELLLVSKNYVASRQLDVGCIAMSHLGDIQATFDLYVPASAVVGRV